MNVAAIVLAVLVALLLAGCSSLRMPPPAANGEDTGPPSAVFPWPDWSSETEEVQNLLAYYQRMLGVSADDLRKEFNAVNQVFNRDKTENARLKLVLLLSVPNTTFRDDSRVVSLLENSLSRTAAAESPRRQLVTLLSRLSTDRLRQVAQVKDEQKKQETQLKDELRRVEEQLKRTDEYQKRADEQQKRADEQQKRADELQEKLDKLLAIERELRRKPGLPPN
ncbi:MAG: hypothetical protein H6R12_1877 [Proteobacteria bacterium]|jgi:DNA repair exonuclease SbcCD ATPase subunit|nr:hypothetical protein [Pseudomonadota bacterium]